MTHLRKDPLARQFVFSYLRLMLIVVICACLVLASGCQAAVPSSNVEMSSPGTSSAFTTSETTPAPIETDALSQATLGRYRVGEVRDYQGMRLDPAIGPSDNSIKGIQQVNLEDYQLRIDGLVKAPIELTYDNVLEMTPDQRLITLYCVEGWEATILWEGVRIKELIAKAGGATESANMVIFHCVDGYTTSLSLYVIENWDIILAYKANDIPLPPEMGFPFIVVAERKFGYKWARWVTRIELSDNESYRGYWESRGWDNNASIYS